MEQELRSICQLSSNLGSDFVHVMDYFMGKDKATWKQEVEDLMTRCASLGWLKQPALQQVPASQASSIDFWDGHYSDFP